MLIGQVEDHRTQRPASSPEPVGLEQCRDLGAVVAELAPNWSVELRHDVLGIATIVILPENLDDVSGPTLFVHREGPAFHLEEVRWGTYRKLDDYPAWADVLRAVRIRLVWEMPFPTTLTDQRC
jgi:hypothetical protein